MADNSGLVICGRVGKHTGRYIEEIIVTMQGRTSCQTLHTDDWGGYERVMPEELEHTILPPTAHFADALPIVLYL